LSYLRPQRVGDGSEYYALFYAWKDTLRPWMTVRSFDSYELLTKQSNIIGMVPRITLEQYFPSLRLPNTADFNHFWFYSFLAFLSSKLLSIIGFQGNAHQAFLSLHFLLTLATAYIAFQLYKWRGLLALLLMTIASPVLWYFDKVHTELFTYCTVLMSIMFILKNYYLATAFLLAFASTQNPSFAIIAFIPFIYRLFFLRQINFTFNELILAIGTSILVLLHPLYYFTRFGVPTPQLLAGGASLGGNLSTFYIWLIDPDLGLLTNWPVGVFFSIAALLIVFFNWKIIKTYPVNKFFIFFIFSFFVVNFFAHSSTTNLNSGATPGIARYSLWYLPAFFPIIYFVLKNYPNKKYLTIPALLLVISLTIFSLIINNPQKPEDYATPNRLSLIIQTHLSFLYNPPAEVFAERYSGLGESIHTINPRGVLGPDCKKILIYPGSGRTNVTLQPSCFVDILKIQDIANTLSNENLSKIPFYGYLDKKSSSEILLSFKPGDYLVGQSKNGNQILRSGWSTPEAWGVWSNGNVSKISLPCNASQFYYRQSKINISLHLQPFGNQNISIFRNGLMAYEGSLSDFKIINFSADVEGCRNSTIDISINISNPKSPFELGQSPDARKLGLGLTKFELR